MDDYISENNKLKDSRNIECAKNHLCMQKYKDYIIFKYEDSIIYNDYSDGSGLGLLIVDQDSHYHLHFQQNYYSVSQYVEMADKMATLPKTMIVIVYSFGKWSREMSPELQLQLYSIGGFQLVKASQQYQFITIGRQQLCSNNGVNKRFDSELSYSLNLDYDPRFSQFVPIIDNLLYDSHSRKVKIYGYRLG